jgi:tRNA(adenine34) deaminase
MDFDRLMQEALAEARWARDTFEVPIGAVVVVDGEIIGRGFNHPINGLDPSAHAEIAAMRQAAIRLGNYRLTGATLCVTIEPCLMCVGAMVHARIGTLVYGAAEPKSGAIVSTIRGAELPGLNHRFEVVSGIREECRGLMVEFFESAVRSSAISPILLSSGRPLLRRPRHCNCCLEAQGLRRPHMRHEPQFCSKCQFCPSTRGASRKDRDRRVASG